MSSKLGVFTPQLKLIRVSQSALTCHCTGRCVFPQSVVCLAQPFDDVASSRTALRPHHRCGASLKHQPSERRQIATNKAERFIVAAFLFALRRDFLLSPSLTPCVCVCACVCSVIIPCNGCRVYYHVFIITPYRAWYSPRPFRASSVTIAACHFCYSHSHIRMYHKCTRR